jgi:hypothetical protein
MSDAELWALWQQRHPNPSGLAWPQLLWHRLRGGQPLTPAPAHHAALHATLLAAGLPGITWIPSPNYSPNRDGHNPNWTASDPNTWFVEHTMVGFMGPTIAAFQSVARQASAHYLIGLDGSIVQMVHETDGAWTNGTYANNPGSNLDSITVEDEDGGDYNGPRTPALYRALALLLADIHQRRNIPVIHRGVGGGVLGHKECNGAQTACPDSLDIDGSITNANIYLAGGNPFPPVPVPVGDDDMLYVGPFHALAGNVTAFAPSTTYHDPATTALAVGTLAQNQAVNVVGYRFTSSAVQSSDRGLGAGPGPDYIWWKLSDGTWTPDADLDTTGLTGALDGAAVSTLPAGMSTWFATVDQAGADDDSGFATHKEVTDAVAAVKVPTKATATTTVTLS